MTGRAGPARIYGKLRSNPEYVGRLSEKDPDATFSDWLDRATGFALHEGSSRWEGAYTAGATHGMLFRAAPQATAALLATIVPSQDSVGRPFPLMTVTTADVSQPDAIPYLPASGHDFFAAGAGPLSDARRAGSLAPATSVLASLQSPQPADLAAATVNLRRWQENRLTKLWKALFPRERAEGGRQALEALYACASSAKMSDRGDLRLPLRAGAGAAACFWLQALGKLMGDGGRSISIAAWSLEPEGSLQVAVAGEPPLDFWLRLWLDDDASSTAGRGRGIEREALPTDVMRVLRSREARIRDLLDVMGPPATQPKGTC